MVRPLMEAILAAILQLLTSRHGGEWTASATEQARYEVVAQAIGHAAALATCASGDPSCERIWPGEAKELEAMLTTIGFYESGFERRVHADECWENECDAKRLPGGVVIHRARSLWQVQAQAVVPLLEWRRIGGVDLPSTERAALAATRVLASGRARCAPHGTWETATVAAYATGRHCSWPGAAARVQTYHVVLRALRATSALE